MKFYCIKYERSFDVDKIKTEQKFFCYAQTKVQARKRFCETTGNKVSTILSIIEVEQ